MRSAVLIASFDTDLHGRAVEQALRARGTRVAYLPTDRLIGSTELTWAAGSGRLPTVRLRLADCALDAAEVGLVWWRRTGARQTNLPKLDALDNDLIENDWKATCLGALWSCVPGVWLNDPWATVRAENKLVQLTAAIRCGFTVPDCIVSNDPDAVSVFQAEGPMALKPVRGSQLRPLLSARLGPLERIPASAVRLVPATYQRFVEGTEHLRVHWFGERVIAVRILSESNDWRGDLPEAVEAVPLDPELRRGLDRLMATLGLGMGIVDVKIDRSGTPYWLEVNPQGQFLFCEGLGAGGLLETFVDFLLETLECSDRD